MYESKEAAAVKMKESKEAASVKMKAMQDKFKSMFWHLVIVIHNPIN